MAEQSGIPGSNNDGKDPTADVGRQGMAMSTLATQQKHQTFHGFDGYPTRGFVFSQDIQSQRMEAYWKEKYPHMYDNDGNRKSVREIISIPKDPFDLVEDRCVAEYYVFLAGECQKYIAAKTTASVSDRVFGWSKDYFGPPGNQNQLNLLNVDLSAPDMSPPGMYFRNQPTLFDIDRRSPYCLPFRINPAVLPGMPPMLIRRFPDDATPESVKDPRVGSNRHHPESGGHGAYTVGPHGSANWSFGSHNAAPENRYPSWELHGHPSMQPPSGMQPPPGMQAPPGMHAPPGMQAPPGLHGPQLSRFHSYGEHQPHQSHGGYGFQPLDPYKPATGNQRNAKGKSKGKGKKHGGK